MFGEATLAFAQPHSRTTACKTSTTQAASTLPMTHSSLTQADADALLAMEKRRSDLTERDYPDPGGRIEVPLVSSDGRERFFLDLRRTRVDLAKGTYQSRGRQVTTLARLDFGGTPHRNPDGKDIGSPHLHLYREGFGDKWAIPVPLDQFPNLDDPWLTLDDFMRFCNVVEPPIIRRREFT